MTVRVDAIGNVIGRYAADPAAAAPKVLMTGSHFDTVRNGGRYDGRLGILLPIAVVGALHAAGIRLPYHFEIVGFAEEEGLRFKTSFLASSVLAGRFDPALLDRVDPDGVTMREALAQSGLPGAGQPGRLARRGSRSGHAGGVRRSAYRAGPGAAEPRPGARHRHADRGQQPLRRCAWRGWPAMPAPRRWTCGATPLPAPPR